MTRRVPPNEAQPVVQRIRIQYAKSGRMRFASHRDFQRSLERAVRRADLPVAFSGGFSPRPRIAYANAAPTGTASRAEYVELGMREAVDPVGLADALSAALPQGFDVLAAVPSAGGSVADRLEASVWELRLTGIDATEVESAVSALLAAAPVTVARVAQSGVKEVPVTQAWVGHTVSDVGAADSGAACAILQVVVRHVTPTVRPQDVLTALVDRAGLREPAAAVFTRLSQGPLKGDPPTVVDPLSEVE